MSRKFVKKTNKVKLSFKLESMDRFLKRTHSEEEPASSTSSASSESTSKAKSKSRKYEASYIEFGFVLTKKKDGLDYPKCVICQEVLSNECLKPSKLKRHLEQKHPNDVGKHMDFFKRKAALLTKQASAFTQQVTVSERALKASFLASYHIARAKKPHTIGEDLILPATKDIVRELLGEEAARKIDTVPLSDNTVCRRISDMAEDVTEQLLEQVKDSPCFALQLDESTDVANAAQLLVYVRFIRDGKFVEELLFCKEIEGRTTGQDIFGVLDEFMQTNSIDWSHCVGVCTDGAAAMTGKRSGVVALIKAKAPDAVGTHCMLHREALVAKRMEDELQQVLQDVVKIVNSIKARPLKHRMFAKLCHDMGANFESVLLHSEVRWLSRGAVFKRVFELRKELREFLVSENSQFAPCFDNQSWVLKLAYLSDIFLLLNALNQSMQGRDLSILNLQDKVRAFVQKI